MMTAARTRVFRAVLVDDQSRLSRSLEDTLALTRRLRGYDVELIDCAAGISSRDRSAKMISVVQGLINERYIEDLRDKTHRGLWGRARKGFWAGGRCYGYTTRPEDDP